MGRIRIKKKDSVLAFRETVAFRFILAVSCFLIFVIASIQTLRSIQQGNTPSIVISLVLSVAAISFAIYNVSKMREAKVPRRAAQRMKRYR